RTLESNTGARRLLLDLIPRRRRGRALLGGRSLPEREWDDANSHRQKQVKGASKKMRFDVGISLFFHFYLLSGSAFWLVCSADVLRNLRSEVFGILRKSENLTWGSVVRSPTVCVPGSAAYRGKAPIFGQVNPLLTYKGFGAAGVDLSLTSRPRLEGFTTQICTRFGY